MISTSGLEKIRVKYKTMNSDSAFSRSSISSLPCDYVSILQDEAGTAAIKTVELDTILGGRAIQHRELQGYESDKFLSYFKPCIIPMEGGFASGFKKPEEEKFETRLYICKGKRGIRVKQVWKDFSPRSFT
jgi:hypothetical protein